MEPRESRMQAPVTRKRLRGTRMELGAPAGTRTSPGAPAEPRMQAPGTRMQALASP